MVLLTNRIGIRALVALLAVAGMLATAPAAGAQEIPAEYTAWEDLHFVDHDAAGRLVVAGDIYSPRYASYTCPLPHAGENPPILPSDMIVHRYLADGRLDASFGDQGTVRYRPAGIMEGAYITDLFIDGNAVVLAARTYDDASCWTSHIQFMRVSEDGTIDPGSEGDAVGYGTHVARDDGVTWVTTSQLQRLIRIAADGTTDRSAGDDPVEGPSPMPSAVAAHDGSAYLGLNYTDGSPAIWRYTSTPPAPDPDFGDGLHDGYIRVSRPDGTAFLPGVQWLSKLAFDSAGRLLVGLTYFDGINPDTGNSNAISVVARYLPEGYLDTGYGDGGFAIVTRPDGSAGDEMLGDLIVDSQDRAIATIQPVNGSGGVARITADGQPDPDFGVNGTEMHPELGGSWPQASLDASDNIYLPGIPVPAVTEPEPGTLTARMSATAVAGPVCPAGGLRLSRSMVIKILSSGIRDRAFGCTAPDAPGSLSAAPKAQSAQLTWAAPAADGHAPVTGYRVGWSAPGKAAGSMTVKGRTATVPGLAAGAPYTVTVAAVNALGTGPSVSVQVTPSGVLGAPRSVTVAPGPRRASVSWAAPTPAFGQTVIGYTVTWSAPTGSRSAMVTGTSLALTGLADGTLYSVRVAARTAATTGPAAPAVSVRPASPPGIPQQLRAAASAGSVTAGWRAPVSAGGSAITGYLVRYRVGSGAWTARTITGTSLTTVLPRHAAAMFTVAARTAAGTGAAATVTVSTG